MMSLLEFQRPVHAEMSAILDAGRRGVSPKGAYLYCTTYPCHLCMKEIIAAGVWKVVYIEPYPKSRSVAMYGDALAIGKSIHDSQSTEIASVSVDPFIGVSPRAYRRLFVEQQYRRKDSRGEVVRQPLNTALPKAGYLRPLLSVSEREGIAILPLVPLDENEEMEQ
ncbi:hypothetical protein DV26_44765 [Amycolatopsis mediterranei]|nr:hypothetical protein DV26_44765 [Amycolatopsis mediterranei]